MLLRCKYLRRSVFTLQKSAFSLTNWTVKKNRLPMLQQPISRMLFVFGHIYICCNGGKTKLNKKRTWLKWKINYKTFACTRCVSVYVCVHKRKSLNECHCHALNDIHLESTLCCSLSPVFFRAIFRVHFFVPAAASRQFCFGDIAQSMTNLIKFPLNINWYVTDFFPRSIETLVGHYLYAMPWIRCVFVLNFTQIKFEFEEKNSANRGKKTANKIFVFPLQWYFKWIWWNLFEFVCICLR